MAAESDRMRPIMKPAAALLAALLLAGCAGYTATPEAGSEPTEARAPALTVTVAAVETMTARTAVAATGTVVAWQEVVVGAEASGIPIVEVKVEEGDTVEAGQLLLRLDDALIQAQVAEQEAAVGEAEASLEAARTTKQRAETLLRKDAISRETAEEADTALKSAEARLAQAKAALSALEVQLERTRIVAPAAGAISAPPALLGAIVQTGTELVRIIRDGRLEVEAEVPEQYLAGIRTGQAVAMTDAAGNTVAGQVRAVAMAVDSHSRLGTVYVALPEAAGLRPGMFARVSISTDAAPMLGVIQSAIVWRDSKPYVFVVGSDNSVEMRAVVTGPRDGDSIAISAGLSEGEMVVRTGGGFLNDGNTVRIGAAGADAPAEAEVIR
jgi:RND family efflux transporter MFP subunit